MSKVVVGGVQIQYNGTSICVDCARKADCHLGPTSSCTLFQDALYPPTCPKCGGLMLMAKPGQKEHIRCPKNPKQVDPETGEIIYRKVEVAAC